MQLSDVFDSSNKSGDIKKKKCEINLLLVLKHPCVPICMLMRMHLNILCVVSIQGYVYVASSSEVAVTKLITKIKIMKKAKEHM